LDRRREPSCKPAAVIIPAVRDHDAVLFDLDGVLLDSRVPFVQCVNTALVENGLAPRQAQELYRYLGPPLHQAFAELTEDRSLALACVDSYRRHYTEVGPLATTVFPGMRELLGELCVHTPLAVATAKAQAVAEPLLEALELRAFFIAVLGPDLHVEDEPKEQTIQRALTHFSDDALPVMVGDRKHDIIAAHANDIPAIGVLWGIGSQQELRDAGADALVENADELALVLREHRQ
jgi:phosphoglycolate phosphatase